MSRDLTVQEWNHIYQLMVKYRAELVTYKTDPNKPKVVVTLQCDDPPAHAEFPVSYMKVLFQSKG